MLKVLVTMCDPDGLPRAWASGPAEKKEDVEKLAERHLAAYCEEKRALGDPLGHATFVKKVIEFDPNKEGDRE